MLSYRSVLFPQEWSLIQKLEGIIIIIIVITIEL